jgi:hypothetical protein
METTESTFEKAVETLLKELESDGNAPVLERVKAEAGQENAETQDAAHCAAQCVAQSVAQCALGRYYFHRANPRCEEDPESYNDNGYYSWDAVWDERLMQEALALLTAAAQSSAPAQCYLAECYWKLSNVLDETLDHLMFYYDHSYSQSELIEDHEELGDIEKYWDEGFEWYEKAAEQGYPKALNVLGDY